MRSVVFQIFKDNVNKNLNYKDLDSVIFLNMRLYAKVSVSVTFDYFYLS